MEFSQSILIDNHKLEFENFIKLLGIEINLNFQKHVTERQKARHQLNTRHAYVSTLDFKK